MEKSYLNFNEEIVLKYFQLFYEYDSENNLKKKNYDNLKVAFHTIKQDYLDKKLELSDFLQIINLVYKNMVNDPNIKYHYNFLLDIIIDIIEHKENNNEKINIEIYELIIFCYDQNADKINIINYLNKAIKIDPYNKTILFLSIKNHIYIEESINLIDNMHFSNIDSIGLRYMIIYHYIKNNLITKNINKIEKYYKIIEETLDKYNSSYLEYITNNYEENELLYIYFWSYEALYATINIKELDILIKSINNEENIENIIKIYENQTELIPENIISLACLYINNEEYKKSFNLLEKYQDDDRLKYDSIFNILFAKSIYKRNGESTESAYQSIEFFKYAIDRIETSNVLDYVIDEALNSILLINQMNKKGYIEENYAKFLLDNLYFKYKDNFFLQFKLLKISYEIEEYLISKNIIDNLINSELYKLMIDDKIKEQLNLEFKKYFNNSDFNIKELEKLNFQKEIKTSIINYRINSICNLNQDNIEELRNIFKEEDFIYYKDILIEIINKLSHSTLLSKDNKIKNKNVLIDLYEIISISRKELVVMRLFDYIRNADAYAHRQFDKTIGEEITNKVAQWKATEVKTNYKNKQYTLYYHFHSSSEIKKDANGNIVKDNRGKPLRRLPNDDCIAINQIRDSLAHRVNEKTSDVNEEIINAKKTREFIDKNYTAILECLFNVIKENNLLTDEQFRSDEF